MHGQSAALLPPETPGYVTVPLLFEIPTAPSPGLVVTSARETTITGSTNMKEWTPIIHIINTQRVEIVVRMSATNAPRMFYLVQKWE